ncbi:MAG: phosphoglycerate kinase [Bdellovibrionales bacterium]|nr:phosphoglycerate kinase [Bdellovibrionales bacterium]
MAPIVSSPQLKSYPGGERIRTLSDLEVENKRVFVRVDFNVPMQDGEITDDTRIRAALPTLQNLVSRGAKVICASHLGRPKDGPEPKFSMEPVAVRLGELMNMDVVFAHESIGDAVGRQARDLRQGHIVVLENLRFHAGEEKNTPDFAHKLAALCDAYVNDAFGTCHRAHASTAGLPNIMKAKAAGLLLEKEIGTLATLIHNPQRPLVAVLGGSKVSDKIKVIEALMVKSSKILIGGAMAYTFLRALKIETGSSRVETDMVGLAGRLLERSKTSGCKIILPMDHVTGASFDNPGTPQITENTHIMGNRMGLDIGPRTRELFRKEMQGAQTLFWNGPMGVFEKPDFAAGTMAVAQAIADLQIPAKICGGGDSVAAVNAAGLEHGFTHISTGGGASLEMIEGAPMPGIEALKVNP